uniref:Uncharacterized protein n=1 Tax=Siphoviridae sp. ctGkF2 TaxID=2827823 RepID=A0A8S5TL05_9CAUD|nr:MAG TPA: hypothetical protein [Siphoviridae sp. ctGkF2]
MSWEVDNVYSHSYSSNHNNLRNTAEDENSA